MSHTFLGRATAACTLARVAAAFGIADAQRRQPAGPDFEAFYELGPDSLVRRGVPKGATEGPFTLTSGGYDALRPIRRTFAAPGQADPRRARVR